MLITDRVALITGAASGIGLAIARRFAAEGAKVIIADVNREAGEDSCADLKQQGREAVFIEMDVSNENSVNQAVKNVVDHFGRIDILVNNAGVQMIYPLIDFPFEAWKKILAIQLDGAFLTSKACMQHMINVGQGGRIIFMGSVHSKEASKLKSAYVTAKHGLLGLCRAVAKEGAEHAITANIICPGFVRTPLVQEQIPKLADELEITEEQVIKDVMLKGTCNGEFTTVEDIAETALYFARFDSNALSGQSIVVSHGWYME